MTSIVIERLANAVEGDLIGMKSGNLPGELEIFVKPNIISLPAILGQLVKEGLIEIMDFQFYPDRKRIWIREK